MSSRTYARYRGHVGETVRATNPYHAIEHRDPFPDQEPFVAWFEAHVAGPLGLADTASAEYLKAFTVARAARSASRMHGLAVRARQVKEAMA